MSLNIFSRIKRRLYTSKLGGWYFELLLWLDRRKQISETKALLNEPTMEINRSKENYDKAVDKLNETVLTKAQATGKSYNEILLGYGENLIDTMSHSTQHRQDRANLIKKFAVKQGDKDVVNDLDKARMIQSRIEDYDILREANAKRKLRRELRAAYAEGNAELVSSLESKLKGKYGRF